MKKRMFGMAFLVCLVAGILVSTAAFAANINVPADQPTIQAGVDAASDGDMVVVAAGVYTGDGNTNVLIEAKAIKVVSTDATQCTVDCEGTGTGFIFEGSGDGETVLEGFTIINASEGAIRISDASPTIRSCILTNNGGGDSYGGAIDASNSSSLIQGCGIANNKAKNGAALRASYSKLRLKNCVVAFNQAEQAGGAFSITYSGLNVLNCTIALNESAPLSGGAFYCVKSPQVVIRNSILWGSSSPQIVTDNVADYDITYSNISDFYFGEGNIMQAPKFVQVKSGDFRLLPNSPCIDTGNNDANGLPPTDIAGNPRIVDGNGDGEAIVDMGAYEFQPPSES